MKRTVRPGLIVTVGAALALAGAAGAQRPGMMIGGGPLGSAPNMSNALGLLQKVEVQNELHMDIKQKQQIADLQDGARKDMMSRMEQMRNSFDPSSLQNMTQEQRMQKMEELRPQFEGIMTQWQGAINDKIKGFLKPEQVTRLHQLDLQRRGPMALSDIQVAEELKIAPAHRTAIARIMQEWQQGQGQIMAEAFQQAQQNGQMPDFQSKLSPLRQKIEKLRRTAEAKALAVLTPEEDASWKAALGQPFAFREDPPMQVGGPRRGGL